MDKTENFMLYFSTLLNVGGTYRVVRKAYRLHPFPMHFIAKFSNKMRGKGM